MKTLTVTPSSDQGAPTALVPPLRMRRRPSLLAAGALSVLLGSLLGVYVYSSQENTVEVAVVRQSITKGALINAESLTVARVSADPALHPVSMAQAEEMVGKRAAVDLPVGSFLTAAAVSDSLVPPMKHSVVGLNLVPGQMPAMELAVGDRVRVVGWSKDAASSPPMKTVSARVAAVRRTEDETSTLVDVEVGADLAEELAARAATGEVALVLDSQEL